MTDEQKLTAMLAGIHRETTGQPVPPEDHLLLPEGNRQYVYFDMGSPGAGLEIDLNYTDALDNAATAEERAALMRAKFPWLPPDIINQLATKIRGS